MGESRYQHGAIDVRSQDMGFFRQVGCLSDYVVAARVYVCDVRGTVGAGGSNVDDVAYRYRISGADAFDSEVAFYLARNFCSSIERLDHEVRTGVAYYSSCHFLKIWCKITTFS